MLTPEQITELKEQLSEQIESLPPQQKAEAQNQIDEMSPEALETMLKQQQSKEPDKSVIRMIVDGEIPSRKIDSNKNAIAVLEIRPASKGHVIILPLRSIAQHESIPSGIFAFANKIARRIKAKLKPKGVEIQTETKFHEQLINIIPYYEKPASLASPRYKATEEELNAMQKILAVRPRTAPIRKTPLLKSQESSSGRITIKRRIP